MKVAPLVLAAGQGSRFGTPSKLLATYQDRPLISHVFGALAEAGLNQGFVAIPDDARRAELSAVVPAGFDIEAVDQSDIAMGLSLAALVRRTPVGHHFLVVLADQPCLTAAAIRALLDQASDSIPSRLSHQGQPGHPVFIPARFREDLLALKGDNGPRALLKRWGCETVEIDDPWVLFDVDTPQALEELRTHA